MDQNLIVLVLVLITIVVSFYSAYLALTAHRKLNKVQAEFKKNISLLNESIALNQQASNLNHPQMDIPIEKEHSRNDNRTMLNDLDQFPSLEEIAQANLEPLDNDVKNGINNLENMDEVTNEEDNESHLGTNGIDEALEQEVVEDLVVEVRNEQEDLVLQDTLDNIDLEMHNMESVLEEQDLEVELEDEVVVEEVAVDELVEVAEVAELSIQKDVENELPRLEDLTEDILSKFPDKQIKEICKRENIRVKGTKREKIERILKFKEYQVQL